MQKSVFNAQIASTYDETLPRHVSEHYLKKRLRFFLRYLKPYAKVLDIGCGTGSILKALSRDGALKLYGCDNSVEMLKKADGKGDISFACAMSDQLPYAQNTFDLVISVAVFHHLGSEETAANTTREMMRVLKDGGKAIVWDANPLNPYWLILFKRIPHDRGVKGHMPLVKIISSIRDAGITDIEVFKSGWIPDFAPKSIFLLFKVFENIMEHIPLLNLFSAHNVIVLSKGKSAYVEK